MSAPGWELLAVTPIVQMLARTADALRSATPMYPSRLHLLVIAVPPVAASFAVLSLGAVGGGIWLIHILAICLACVLSVAGNQLPRLARAPWPAAAIILLTLAAVAVPLLRDSPGPNRWASLGPVNLYVASLVLPSFLAACSVYARRRGNCDMIAFGSALGVSLVLAAQPDASQALALLVGSTVGFVRYRSDTFKSVITLGAIALVTTWTFSRPDPLEPVPYVEGVFALALGHSLVTGLAVITSAITLVTGLYIRSFRGPSWLSAVAAYYAVLFACSVAGLTPAPLVGYGAGPLLGFGLMVAVSQWVEA
jgi:hypothetical protein